MRKYYLCDAEIPSRIYTENEKCKSALPGCRFGLIGEFSTRKKAEAALSSAWNGTAYALQDSGGETVCVEGVR